MAQGNFSLGSGHEIETQAVQKDFEQRAQYEERILGLKKNMTAEDE
jgi:hypothetical protein